MKDKIRIASGQGFWGDLLEVPLLYPEFISGTFENRNYFIKKAEDAETIRRRWTA